MNTGNFKKYSDKKSVTEYKEFVAHNHYILGLPTWKKVADSILSWLEKH